MLVHLPFCVSVNIIDGLRTFTRICIFIGGSETRKWLRAPKIWHVFPPFPEIHWSNVNFRLAFPSRKQTVGRREGENKRRREAIKYRSAIHFLRARSCRFDSIKDLPFLIGDGQVDSSEFIDKTKIRYEEFRARCKNHKLWKGWKITSNDRIEAKNLTSCAGMTCHVRREFFFAPQLQYFSQFYVYLSTTQAKQTINILLLNNFYLSSKRKRRIIVYGLATRYGSQSVASASG